ncbi:uncharacterized protein BP01DRAFT_359019 [Aspergillus saccharolyticus JOP 1030-1]|uniref:Uncharacterized protein n=1 Tax=Aspergillus saccharolyticus JOP 1030-1 TaxID=1450539 RepID=A0A318Z9G2_9EURO|nr:hypothetical protein BP01DRAFT_359019 [Aspergillus saccharolyticus JOP 1030-1]PYH43057.1 hypothetical protein BP01DRAFT_359019 [Aspergillus saccharolyticus JOP 1030-1]
MEAIVDSIPEQLFLDLRVSAVRNRTARLNLVEPWATEYCTAVLEKRYGDAIFARYNIAGQAVDGVYSEWNITVYDMIMSDAQEYAQDHPELFADALQIYNNTNSTDTRRDIIEGLKKITFDYPLSLPA